jgi:hypothetical protein
MSLLGFQFPSSIKVICSTLKHCHESQKKTLHRLFQLLKNAHILSWTILAKIYYDLAHQEMKTFGSISKLHFQ